MNDLYSFNKEVDDEFRGNAVHQIQIETHCSSAEAMRMVHRMVQRERELFAQNCESILNRREYEYDPVVHRYVAAAKHLVAANVQCLTNDPRYRSANDRAAALPR